MANFDWSKLGAYLEDKGRDMEQGVGTALFELSSDIINRTPVDEGGARGSWTPDINQMSSSSSNTVDKSGKRTINSARAKTKKFKLGDTFYLFSNLVYMPKLEFGGYSQGAGATSKTTRDGFSIQAPHGMVRKSIDNFGKNLDKAIKDEQ
jgi:hypothetical protein